MTHHCHYCGRTSDPHSTAADPRDRLAGDSRSAKPARAYKTVAVGAGATGASAIGAAVISVVAVGAVAIGALAIGRLVIKRLAVRRSHFDHIEINDLAVRRLHVEELVVTKRYETPDGQDNDHTAGAS